MKTLLVLLMAFALVSCGTLRKNTNKQAAKSETAEQVQTKTTTTIKESVDTNVTIPGTTSSINAPIDQVLSGDTIRAKQGNTALMLHYNRQTKQLTASAEIEPVSVPIRMNRETTIEQDQKATKQEKSESSVKTQETQRDSGINWTIIVLILIASLALVLYLSR